MGIVDGTPDRTIVNKRSVMNRTPSEPAIVVNPPLHPQGILGPHRKRATSFEEESKTTTTSVVPSASRVRRSSEMLDDGEKEEPMPKLIKQTVPRPAEHEFVKPYPVSGFRPPPIDTALIRELMQAASVCYSNRTQNTPHAIATQHRSTNGGGNENGVQPLGLVL